MMAHLATVRTTFRGVVKIRPMVSERIKDY